MFLKIQKVFKILASYQKKWESCRGKTLVAADRGLSTGGSKGFGDSGNGRDVHECVCRGDGKGV